MKKAIIPNKTGAVLSKKPSLIGKLDDVCSGSERIARRLSRVGLCSRRDAERLITSRRVQVNGTILTSPACVVVPRDLIMVDGKVIPKAAPRRLWLYHKPSGLLTTRHDPQGRQTIFDRMPKDLPRLITVGRLDFSSEGLMLLTNDGALARHLELPQTGWSRRYRVRVHGKPDPHALLKLADGIKIGDITYGSIQAMCDREQGSNAWLTMDLCEGRNREIRRIMEHLGLQVTRLIRVAYGAFQLGTLSSGSVTPVPDHVLSDQLGEQGRIAGDADPHRLRNTKKTAPQIRDQKIRALVANKSKTRRTSRSSEQASGQKKAKS